MPRCVLGGLESERDEVPTSFSSTTGERPSASARAHPLEESLRALSFDVRSVPEVFFHDVCAIIRAQCWEINPHTKIGSSGWRFGPNGQFGVGVKEKSLEPGRVNCYNAFLDPQTPV